ncbi:putative membrane protein [Propionispora sp. 2/2-37]|uniref:polysaccharide deacetylase family sporulation protein PdaB n=1 Tax=Propionispora sp. 2/2-37 TaxID=1677858 RepID=UPI0006BB8719|nr:polysaccharide deacetylase family sporulation protein PdaB [Propionispora sp. 2/2-37]CUH96298.1 putative membrane protein [Propionispora sp. 2/2-37]
MVFNLRRFRTYRHLFYSMIGLLAISTVYVEIAELIANGPMAIAGTRTEQKVVALTFDHSWGNKFTPSILDTLKQNDVKVTFFIMGPWAKKFPEVAQRMVTDGHEIASHGYRHENYGDKPTEWVREDIQKAHELIKEVTGAEPTLLRPPNGHYSQNSLKVTDELGYKTIIWNVDSLDWKNPGRDVIVERVMKRLKPGAIILMHASDTPVQTAEALPILLDKIKAEGYKIVTVGELLQNYSEKGLLKH